jgi:hypothetical protein
VRFSLSKNGESVLTDKPLHSGDWFDPSFAMLYPQHKWESDNVLHFYREEYFSHGTPSTITVVNNSGRAINYLRVTSVDTFLLFDVPAGSKTDLPVSPPRGNVRWVSVGGEFSEEQRIKENGANFLIRQGLGLPSTYYVYITGDVPTIESPHLEKYIQ